MALALFFSFLDILHNRNLMFVNLMVNSGGMMLTLLGTVSHASMSTFSNQSEANLLAAIDRIKVTCCHNSNYDKGDNVLKLMFKC